MVEQTKILRLTTQKGRKNGFSLLEPSHPQTGTVQSQDRIPQIEKDPFARKGKL